MADSKLLNTSSSASPPPNCAICLGSCSNKCFSDTCMHQFCFNCLLQWSKIKAECPLCKQPFKSIIHNVKSNEEYEEHIVEQPRPVHILDNEQYHLILPHSPPNPSRHHRFHFRTTFTVNTHGENAIQRMLMSHSLTNGITISNYLPHSSHISGRPRRRQRTTTTNFRRSIYDSNLWASVHSDPMSLTMRFREITPEYFKSNPNSRARLVPWLNRELNALLHENTQDVMEVVDTIMDYLLRHHICSRQFRNLLRTYLNDRAGHFVHEFYNFMRSPFDMVGYDRHVNYYERPTTPTPFIDISEDDSDVMIVEENPEVIEVHSSDSDDDVIMTSSFIPKPRLLPEGSTSRRSRRVSVSSSSSEEQKRGEERPRKHKLKRAKREERDGRRTFRVLDNDSDDDDSSSSVLDDVPLAKYMRIKASIGKKLLKKSSAKAKAKPKDNSKDRNRRSNSRKESSRKMKTAEAASSSSSKPHCSKYCPRRRNSSSSSSSSSSSHKSRNRRNRNRSSSSSSDRTLTPRSSLPKVEKSNNFTANPYNRGSQTFAERMHEKYTSMFRNRSASPEEGPSNTPQVYVPTDREHSASQSTVDTRSSNIQTLNPESLVSPRICSNGRDLENSLNNVGKTKLEMMNRCRQSFMGLQPNPHYAVNHAASSSSAYSSSPYIQSINRNYRVDFHNTRNSPDLIDLSVTSRIRHDHPIGCVPQDFRAKYSSSPPRYYSPCMVEARENSTRRTPNIPLPSTSYTPYNYESVPTNGVLKSEPSYSEYQSEGSTKYWTDLSTQNTSHTNSNDSSYNYPSLLPRKTVIQNSRDNSVPQDEIISPRWSSSNSPSYPCYPENWSDNSD